ncbi:TIGR02391 family protein [Mycobacterium paragordonae]|uniref:Conserved hypothetical protein CHP02391 domain-containing protein n=1 Tax=Mycobacterium paragordonae TaxID=1389713 RepID=A0ABQ1C0R8_9MYCO|nr:TIGR02391 family protein [Mycobacterium paragordonae]GFG77748.1 hypothetical protein MPRG_10240 [Mycobacterium paragordonae]
MTATSKTVRIPVFDPQMTEAVANVLAQTDHPGLSNVEIDNLLQLVRISNRDRSVNKRTSLYVALHNAQVKQACGNVLGAFIARAMHPSRYVGNERRWMQLRDQLDGVLVIFGYRISKEGKLATGTKATTLSAAAKLAGELQVELHRRDTHAELLKYCDEELITRDLFHAMSEATKGVAQRIREQTGLVFDGQDLFDAAFGTAKHRPVLFINNYLSDSDVSEQKGFKNLLIGIYGHFRNPRAHTTRYGATEKLIDFYDLFATLSYVHRRLDGSHI